MKEIEKHLAEKTVESKHHTKSHEKVEPAGKDAVTMGRNDVRPMAVPPPAERANIAAETLADIAREGSVTMAQVHRLKG
jgi:hypothetical protein